MKKHVVWLLLLSLVPRHGHAAQPPVGSLCHAQEASYTEYAVFDYTEDGKRSAGVRVTTADGVEHEARCVGPIHEQLMLLGKSLRCDNDSALNGGRCP